MNLAHIAETKRKSKAAMDVANANVYLSDRKIKEYMKDQNKNQDKIERLESMKLRQIGIASINRQTYMEMVYLSARLTYDQRLKLESVSWK